MIADVEAGVAVQAQPHAIQWDVNRWTHCRIKKSHGRIQSQLECHDRELRSFAELYVAARLCRWIDFTHWLIRGHRVMLIRSGSALGSAKGLRSQRRVPYRPGLDRRRFLLTSPLGVGRADAPRLRPRRAGVPPLWRAATVDRDGRGPEAIRAILGALGGWREREGRARPGRRPVPRGCTAPERRADAAVAEVCSVASWAGGTPLDRRPAPAENPVTRWWSARRRGGERRRGGRERRFRQPGPLSLLCSKRVPWRQHTNES